MAKRLKSVLVEVTNQGWSEDSLEPNYLVTLAGRGEHAGYTLMENVCGEFTNVTGIHLELGESKVFRLQFVPQVKRRSKRS